MRICSSRSTLSSGRASGGARRVVGVLVVPREHLVERTVGDLPAADDGLVLDAPGRVHGPVFPRLRVADAVQRVILHDLQVSPAERLRVSGNRRVLRAPERLDEQDRGRAHDVFHVVRAHDAPGHPLRGTLVGDDAVPEVS
jgi:hypothetical protein